MSDKPDDSKKQKTSDCPPSEAAAVGEVVEVTGSEPVHVVEEKTGEVVETSMETESTATTTTEGATTTTEGVVSAADGEGKGEGVTNRGAGGEEETMVEENRQGVDKENDGDSTQGNVNRKQNGGGDINLLGGGEEKMEDGEAAAGAVSDVSDVSHPVSFLITVSWTVYVCLLSNSQIKNNICICEFSCTCLTLVI